MSQPLTPDDLRILREIDNETGHPDCIEAALARLDYLERKVQAAEVLSAVVHEVNDWNGDAVAVHPSEFDDDIRKARAAYAAYDEVQS